MSDRSPIEWTDATWPVVVGCERCSPGCAGCYAVRDSRRLGGNPNLKISSVYGGLVERRPNGQLDWTGTIRPIEERLEWPLKWRKPRRIFVCNESDLFHDGVPEQFVRRVIEVMRRCPQHTFQVLTKRPERMKELLAAWTPLPNVWLGVSVETQRYVGERIPPLLSTPAALRFLSCEPLLGPLDISGHLGAGIGWVIVGGESGPAARTCQQEWIESVIRQCDAARVPIFVKQLGGNTIALDALRRRYMDRKGGDPCEWPGPLRRREFPAGR